MKAKFFCVLIFSLLTFITVTSQEYTTIYGTPSQVMAAGIGSQLGNALNEFGAAARQRANFEHKVNEARIDFWEAHNKNVVTDEIEQNYINMLTAKDGYYLELEMNNFVSVKSDYMKKFDLLLGLGNEFDGGLSGFEKSYYLRWVKAVKKEIAEVNTNELSIDKGVYFNAIENNKQLYLNYVTQRNISEFLTRNKYTPLNSSDSKTYLSSLLMLFRQCENMDKCGEKVQDIEKRAKGQAFEEIVADLRRDYRNPVDLYNRYGYSHQIMEVGSELSYKIEKQIKNKNEAIGRGQKSDLDYINDYYHDKRKPAKYYGGDGCDAYYMYYVDIVKIEWMPPENVEIDKNTRGSYKIELKHPIYKDVPSKTIITDPYQYNPDHYTMDMVKEFMETEGAVGVLDIKICEEDIQNGNYEVSRVVFILLQF